MEQSVYAVSISTVWGDVEDNEVIHVISSKEPTLEQVTNFIKTSDEYWQVVPDTGKQVALFDLGNIYKAMHIEHISKLNLTVVDFKNTYKALKLCSSIFYLDYAFKLNKELSTSDLLVFSNDFASAFLICQKDQLASMLEKINAHAVTDHSFCVNYTSLPQGLYPLGDSHGIYQAVANQITCEFGLNYHGIIPIHTSNNEAKSVFLQQSMDYSYEEHLNAKISTDDIKQWESK